MKNKTLLKFLFVFLLLSACEVKWDMEISFEEDLSGSYSIAVLIDQEAQMYAVETGQSSIGGLDAILSNLPDGFGSSVYQEGNYLGILIRNDFENTDELLLQFKQLRSEENTALLLLPIQEIQFDDSGRDFGINGKFAEIFVTDEENLEGFKRIFDGQLSVIVPGNITEPQISEIVNNTIIFENDGLSVKTFKLVTRTKPIFTQELIAALISIFGLISYFKNEKKLIITYLLGISIFFELSHLTIPNRSFQFSDLFGNIGGVLLSLLIFNLIKYWREK